MTETSHEITRLLAEAYEGREGALDQVMELCYAELRRIAGGQMRRRYGSGAEQLTMEPTALVNEAFLRLIKQRKRYDSRGHFFAIATKVMLRVLMDYDRQRRSAKRGGDHVQVSLSGLPTRDDADARVDIAAFVQALERLDGLDARTGEVVKLRLIWGLTVAEVAEAMGLSARTVEREWRFGRRWMAAELSEGEASS